MSYFNYRNFLWINIIGLLISILSPFAIFASGYRLTIINEDKQKLSDVVVNVLAYNDSTIIQSLISDSNGYIDLPDSLNQMDLIYVNRLNYETIRIRCNELKDTLKLKSTAKDLKELVVLGNKDVMTARGGKILFTPGSLRKMVTNSYDLIANTPMVREQDKQLTVFGSNVHILLNGKDPEIPQEQVIAELKSLSPDRIKSVEIIPNPGSEYSASSNIRIINVNLTDRQRGTMVTADANFNVSDRSFATHDFLYGYFSYRKLKVMTYGLFVNTHNGQKERAEYIYNQDSPADRINIINTTRSNSTQRSVHGDLFMSYDLTPNSVIGGGVSIVGQNRENDYSTVSETTRSSENPEVSETHSSLKQPWGSPSLFYKIYYNLNTDRQGSCLSLSGAYRHSRNKSQSSYDFAPEFDQTRKESSNGGGMSAKYSQIFNPRQTLKGGIQFQTTSQSDFSSTESLTYSFDYKESIHAAYLELSSIWSDVFSTTAGLRLEHDRMKGMLSDGTDLYDRKSTDLFPSLSTSISFPGGRHILNLDVCRAISRPYFSDMNPYVLWMSANTCSVGNPDLKPSRSWEFSGSYIFLMDYYLRLSYKRFKDEARYVSYGRDGVTVGSTVNLPSSDQFDMFFGLNKVFFRIWRFSTNLRASYGRVNYLYDDIDLSENIWSATVAVRNRVAIPGQHSPIVEFSLMGGYRSQDMGVGSTWHYSMSLGLSKEIIKNLQASCRISYSPLTRNTRKTVMPDYRVYSKDYAIPLSGSISLTYTFGKTYLNIYQGGGDDAYHSRQ